ncbi:molybdenum cofactor guanylyltransferase MobA [Microvirga thermotolerans]|uniref:Molybdenum cofactor guanylyltransferase n=1 Tax=Microvirga thermotolerans TaxID=2651334 RepID=A0A5P9JYV3_9HYPH|nr:molybdenum cofactor guanylyltransferase MobA [Microvirga thermotolerans]QFU17331.1 molybdenum cofactor guanylyltransferase MobA [Microvirga thermotolerans]
MSEARSAPPVLGAILAGGLGTRMGGVDKGLLRLGGEPLLQRIARRLAPQCGGLVLNANGEPDRFADMGLPVIPDAVPGRLGPLSGLLAVLEWAATHRPEVERIVSVSTDTPFLPEDLVARLDAVRRRAEHSPVLATSGGRLHPTIGLWPIRLKDDLRAALVQQHVRSMRAFAERHGYVEAEWPADPVDPFFNINTPEDLAAAGNFLLDQPHA